MKEKQDGAVESNKKPQSPLLLDKKPCNAAEYLFSTGENGEIAEDIDASEVDQIYNTYMQALTSSYDKLKGRFNTFAAKCLSEKQKRETGLLLVAPPLSLPGDREVIEQEIKERQL